MPPPIRLIVGLGNPGVDYEQTRHNAGANLLLKLAHTHHTSLSETSKFFGLCSSFDMDKQTVRLLLPTTFMNRSGQAVGAVANFYKIHSKIVNIPRSIIEKQ